MPISGDQLRAILRELPRDQRTSAAKRIAFADVAGWTDVGLWVWNCCRRHEGDLVGRCPAGTFEFLHYAETTHEDP
jgi:hypothetical protein